MSENDANELPEDDFTEEEYENGFLRWASALIVIATVAGFFALAWYAYKSGTASVSAEDVPLIEADASSASVKEAPSDPGGMQFPNQDKTIYDAISGNRADSSGERVLPPPEEPVEVVSTGTPAAQPVAPADTPGATGEVARGKSLPASTTTETWVNRETVPAPMAATPSPAPAAQAGGTPPRMAPIGLEPVRIESVKPETAKVVAAKPAPTAVAKPVASGTSKVRIQLGAFRSESEAAGQWKKLSAKHGDVLGGKQHHIVRADLGEKGVFHRLQVSGFASESAARSACATLTSRQQGCFLAK